LKARARHRERSIDSKDAGIIFNLAWIYAIGPNPGGEDLAPLIRKVESTLDTKSNVDHMKMLGGLYYRAGNFEAAVKILEEARAKVKGQTDSFQLATALHQLGRRERAEEVFRESAAWSDKILKITPGSPTPFFWDGRARLKRLRAEAADLLKIVPAPPPPDVP
jgi:tetratricopeptide (TPR) repeat protein